MKPRTKTLTLFFVLATLSCATVTIEPGAEESGDGDSATSSGGVVIGSGGSPQSSGGSSSGGSSGDGDSAGDGDGDLIGGDGDLPGDGDGDGAGGMMGTGGAPVSSCSGCKAWSEFGYFMPPPPVAGDCVSGANGTDYVWVSGTYNEACGPPGEAETWCAAMDGVFEPCD